MKMGTACRNCLYGKIIKRIPEDITTEKRESYITELDALIEQCFEKKGSAWMSWQVDLLDRKYFGKTKDYGPIKHKFNQYMLTIEDKIWDEICQAEDSMKCAIQYVCTGNYIDFGAMGDVKLSGFEEQLAAARDAHISDEEIAHFKEDLSKGKNLVYCTDNCGEIVLDKLLIRLMKEHYPNLNITVMVRGDETINDATMVDAKEVGLTEMVDCIGSGKPMPGIIPDEISGEAKDILDAADIVISKGQGNFESLYNEGYNPYFLFLCKCDFFVRRFRVERFTSMFSRECRLTVYEQK